ncbi:MAG: TerC/Alx family metal homeostasis membrane protein [Calditrichaeota bacterium]|nr:TerC/Alx family metal homeostasis membrane protein [Candidatus Cloacimonadota bacterium]MCB1046247.1 TerC/Alx family metal homeostasis membrane protein [Calditrichota bacterium]MCB9473556.1 TerC/Alx family metal homeostasis membrane protein [Candidatus Delongbacteria bacterium]
MGLLALDLGVFHRKAHVVSAREAMGWSAVWITLSLCFAVFVYFGYENQWLGMGSTVDAVDGLVNDGHNAVLKYLTGYVVELSLSVDNVFVIALIFSFFAVPAIYQHRVLFWGIVGAQVLRGVMILAGAKLVAEFHWVLYLFGLFLVITGLRMLLPGDSDPDPANNPVIRFVRRFFPVTARFHGEHFVVRAGSPESRMAALPGQTEQVDEVVARARPGTLLLTPLALTLVIVETTDVVFAVDSIPAIFAITADPFLVFTSNVFAILGLRSFYFALASMLDSFRFLKLSLALVLLVVGGKMLAGEWLQTLLGHNFNLYLLAAVVGILGSGVIASMLFKVEETPAEPKP